jgi:calcium/calmodulin-dependent protein kinase I
MGEEEELSLKNEIDILSQVDHPNVVKMFEIYDTEATIHIVMELLTGGEVNNLLCYSIELLRKSITVKKRLRIPYVQLLTPSDIAMPWALRTEISKYFIHQPENLVYTSKDPGAILKITDFGLAKVFSQTLMTTACGTPGYVAPEVLSGGGYDKSVDYWSIGIVIYIMYLHEQALWVSTILCREQ